MKESGLKWVTREVLNNPFGRGQRIFAELRVDPVLVLEPLEDITRLDGKSESEIQKLLEGKRRQSITYEQIVDLEAQITFVRGVGGIGKSVLSQTLYREWCEERIWRDFDFVFLLKARELNALDFSACSETGFVDFILKSDPGFHDSELCWQDLLSSKKRMLFILDGVDELFVEVDILANLAASSRDMPDLGKGLGKLAHEIFLSDRLFVVFLGRHETSMKLEKAWRSKNRRTQLIELCGYSRQTIVEYIKKFFAEDEKVASRVVDYLDNAPILKPLVSIPLYLWVFCSFKQEFQGDEGNVHEIATETELLINMLLIFVKLHARDPDAHFNKQSEFFELLDDPSLKILLTKYSELAYTFLRRNELIFSLNESKLQPFATDGKGILIATKTPRGYHYQFKHKSLQELLAASYIFKEKIDTSVVLTNTFLWPCLPILCAFEGSLLKNSRSPWLLQEFVKVMLDCNSPSSRCSLLKDIYGNLITGNATLSSQNSGFLEFLRCFNEYNNEVQLDSCITSLSCRDGQSSRDQFLVTNFLRRFSAAGIVRKLRVVLGTNNNEAETKNTMQWFETLKELCEKQKDVPLERRISELRIVFVKDFELDRYMQDVIQQLYLYFKSCQLINVSPHYQCCFERALNAPRNQQTARPMEGKSLVLRTNYQPREAMTLQWLAVAGAPGIDKVDFENVPLGLFHFGALLDNMCRGLRNNLSLRLANCSLGDDHLRLISRYMRWFNELDISENQFSCLSLPDFGALLDNMCGDQRSNLSLRLANCSLGDDHLRLINRYMGCFKELDISKNQFSCYVIKDLASSIRDRPDGTLRLNGFPIGSYMTPSQVSSLLESGNLASLNIFYFDSKPFDWEIDRYRLDLVSILHDHGCVALQKCLFAPFPAGFGLNDDPEELYNFLLPHERLFTDRRVRDMVLPNTRKTKIARLHISPLSRIIEIFAEEERNRSGLHQNIFEGFAKHAKTLEHVLDEVFHTRPGHLTLLSVLGKFRSLSEAFEGLNYTLQWEQAIESVMYSSFIFDS